MSDAKNLLARLSKSMARFRRRSVPAAHLVMGASSLESDQAEAAQMHRILGQTQDMANRLVVGR